VSESLAALPDWGEGIINPPRRRFIILPLRSRANVATSPGEKSITLNPVAGCQRA